MSDERLVLPGDVLGANEEYLPGEGTYEEDGMILASRVGLLCLDDDERVARVLGLKEPALPKVGDVVIGSVKDVGGKVAKIDISSLENRNRGMPTNNQGALHISKMSEDFIDNPRKVFRPTDIVRARIVQIEPSIQLSTGEPELGVLKAYCGRCRLPLKRKGSELYCQDCERTEHRKMSEHYGQPIII